MDQSRRKAVLITANYRGTDDTLEFLRSLRRLKRFEELDVIVVDDASGDDSVPHIRAEVGGLENVRVLASGTNRGYFGAAKWGLATYLDGSSSLPDWVIVCNNDMVFDDPEFLEKLFLRDPASVGVIAPQILSLLTHQDQNPFMETRPSRWQLAGILFWGSNYYIALFRDFIHRMLDRLRSLMNRIKGLTGVTTRRGVARSIYAPHGAFIIFSGKYFGSGGYIDDGFFLSGEEISVAEICRSLGIQILYDPELVVCHKVNRTVGRTLSRFAYNCAKDARRYFMRKYLADIR